MLVLIAGISQLEDTKCFEGAYAVISEYRKNKCDKLKSMSDKRRCVALGLLLNTAVHMWEDDEFAKNLKKNKCIENIDINFMIDSYDWKYDYDIACKDNGKPYFATKRDIHFNMSHGIEYVACVISDSEVGIDVEGGRDIKKRVAERFFSKEECKWIDDGDSEEKRKERFFAVWTAKEAYAKFKGDGIARLMEKTRFVIDDSIHLLGKCGEIDDSVEFFQYVYDKGYYVTVVKEKKHG